MSQSSDPKRIFILTIQVTCGVKYIFLLAGHDVDFIAPCGSNKPIFDHLVEKKNRMQHGKNINFTRVVATLASLKDQTSHL